MGTTAMWFVAFLNGTVADEPCRDSDVDEDGADNQHGHHAQNFGCGHVDRPAWWCQKMIGRLMRFGE